MADLCILLLILAIVISIIYFSESSNSRVALGSAVFGGMLGGAVLGGAPINCNEPIGDDAGIDLGNAAIVCDGTNMMHQWNEAFHDSIFTNTDKAEIFKKIALTLKARFPKAHSIHIVTKNHNIREYRVRETFEQSREYRDLESNKDRYWRDAWGHAERELGNRNPTGEEIRNKAKYIYDRILTGKTSDYKYDWEKRVRKEWKDYQTLQIARDIDYHLREMIRISTELKEHANIYFHLAYQSKVSEKYAHPHEHEARDDVISILLAAKSSRSPFDIGVDTNTYLLSMDYFKPADTAGMASVPDFKYICLNAGGELKNIDNFSINALFGDTPDRFTKYVDELRGSNRLIGFNLNRDGMENHRLGSKIYKQRGRWGIAPVYCLYVTDSLAVQQKAEPAELPPAPEKLLIPDPEVIAALNKRPRAGDDLEEGEVLEDGEISDPAKDGTPAAKRPRADLLAVQGLAPPGLASSSSASTGSPGLSPMPAQT